ncbi:MAG: DUF2341 domain-containing protein [Planctomycetes bacterium]|nr:DUF2341 domain-containing protein [Planctomycetota bacterium]
MSGTADLTDFPVLIQLASDDDLRTTANGGHVEDANGHDIIFRDIDEWTTLDHELERYVPSTGELVAWVRIPTLRGSADTTIYLYYGNEDISSSLENAEGVWDSSFRLVLHLHETSETPGSPNDHVDSTSQGNDGEAQNGVTMDATGQIDGADTFDGDDDHVFIPLDSSLSMTEAITIEAWIYWHGETGATDDLQNVVTNGNWERALRITEPDHWVVGSRVLSCFRIGGNEEQLYSDSQIPTNTWTYVVTTYDGSSQRIYIDGDQDVSASATGSLQAADINSFIGTEETAYYFDGGIDEVRISSVARSADWIKTCHNNQSAPASFYTVGSETSNFATEVRLISFTATGGESGVDVAWETAWEFNTAGFHLARAASPEVPFERITKQMIPAAVGGYGRRYVFHDPDAYPGYPLWYQLIEIGLDLRRTAHGTIGVDWDGDGVPEDRRIGAAAARFVRGDVDGDGRLNIRDPVLVLHFLYGGAPQIPCEKAADVSDDGRLDPDDAILSLRYLFEGSQAPPPPVTCGVDPTPDGLGCQRGETCE